ncbi:MAG: baseplate J/gp47 family protein [Patescibacteria group bacterium]
MKLPETIQELLKKKQEKPQIFLSVVLDSLAVVAEAWSLTETGSVSSFSSVVRNFPEDSWEERIRASDSAIVNLEEKAGTVDIHQVVLGLPAIYLTEEGEIIKDVRGHIKKLTQELALKPLGFVSLPQALIHLLKKDEGVPPSSILIGLSGEKLVVSLYKVGVLAAQKIISYREKIAGEVEEIFKSFTTAEVLPSRMLLYGTNPTKLEELRGELLRHPWPTRANFLHFPKIEILPPSTLITAVSLAGASEMAHALGEEVAEEKPTLEGELTAPVEEEELAVTPPEVEPNVQLVAAEELGFAKSRDILEAPPSPPPRGEPQRRAELPPTTEEEVSQPRRAAIPVKLHWPKISLPALPRFKVGLPALPLAGTAPLLLGGILLLIILGLLYRQVPRATVTILEIPKTLAETTTIIIDPAASGVDIAGKVIPGKKQERSVSGAKTMPATGKKKVGDPARGTVTIYNKVTTGRLFKKGTVIATSSLQFTLDSDVMVASASESIGSITFGKATGGITAVEIGAEGNLPAASEFTFKDYATSVAIARNEQPLTGGTSREVTVVSRADYDNLVKTLTGELVEKAKQDLLGSVTGGEKLIDATVKTAITEKTFNQELDQEVGAVEGKLTVTVSGISYNEGELKEFLKSMLAANIPSGYSTVDNRTTVSVSNPQVRRDGKIVLTVKFEAVALPTLDTAAIKKAIVGKKLETAQEYLRGIPGVGGVEFNFRYSPWRNRLPINQNNISISSAIAE